MNTKISILGCGWLGYPLGLHLHEKGFYVKGSTTSPEKLLTASQSGIEPFIIAFPRDIDSPEGRAFFECEVMVITIPPNLKLKPKNESLSCYIKKLMARLNKSGVSKVVYFSSTAVYGEATGLVTETSPPNPTSERAANLLYIEKVVSETPGICSTILRCAGLAGYNREPGKFLAGRTNLPDPEGPVNLIHRDDCVQLTEQIITKGKWGETYNICADEHPSKREFYTSRSLKVGLVPPTFLDGAKHNGKIISNNKVKKDLDYLFKYPDPMEMP